LFLNIDGVFIKQWRKPSQQWERRSTVPNKQRRQQKTSLRPIKQVCFNEGAACGSGEELIVRSWIYLTV
jgi:hypothetical protein